MFWRRTHGGMVWGHLPRYVYLGKHVDGDEDDDDEDDDDGDDDDDDDDVWYVCMSIVDNHLDLDDDGDDNICW